MLTGSHLVFRRRNGRIHPVLLDPAREAHREGAEALLALFQAHRNRRRGELEQALRGFVPPGLEAKVSAGLARLLLEQCAFEPASEGEPRRLRADLFDAAAARWREQGAADLDRWRVEVVTAVGTAHGLAPEAVEAAMFGDLPDNQVLRETPSMGAERLLLRYNVAQAQGLLLGAERLTLSAPWPDPRRLRQLLRYLKFFGLLFRLERDAEGTELAIRVDGPLSVLESSTRYGLQLAKFLPALLLWDPPWRLEAAVRPLRGSKPAKLTLEPHPWLRSHYPDHGQWVPEAVARFVEAFNRQPSTWRVAPAEALFTLPGNRCLVPDFTLTDHVNGRTVHLEHVNTPSAGTLREKLGLAEALAGSAEPAEYWVACKAPPSLDLALLTSPRLIPYRRTLVPSAVRTRLAGQQPREGEGET